MAPRERKGDPPARPYPELGRLLYRARKRARLTQKDVERMAGLNQSYYSQLERGQKQPSPELIERLSGYLDVPEELLSEAAGYINLGREGRFLRVEPKRFPQARRILDSPENTWQQIVQFARWLEVQAGEAFLLPGSDTDAVAEHEKQHANEREGKQDRPEVDPEACR